MRLSALKLAGFKSFVDPTQLPLPGALTAIVGPNGCGKSNLIDAVRWVLGEASQKQLRTQDSDDVIFNGSKGRKPVGRASVELIFDNSDQQIVGAYAAYSEIAVKRELTRDGNSQYYLNGRKCLKRDVTDLFLGTGLGGKNQYAIIEQGMVSRMIEAKPEELRTWLEEAAGISKYKERRRDTEGRIRQTRENLARLADLRGELGARLEVLRRQAANAEKYREFKQQERRLRAETLALRGRALEGEAALQIIELERRQQALEAAREALAAAELGREHGEQARRAAEAALAQEQSRVYEAEGLLSQREQALTHARELQVLKRRELDQLGRQLQEAERRQLQEAARQAQLQRDLEALDSQLESAQREDSQRQRELAEAEARVAEQEAAWLAFQQRAEQPLLATEGERVRVQALERALFQIEERHKRVAGERAGLDTGPLQTSLFDADSELARLAQDLDATQQRLQTLEADLATLREQRSQLEALIHEDRQQLQTARGRLASLEALQQAALRQDDAPLTDWLRARGLHEAPRLASVLQVEPGWEAALEQVLGPWLQAPLVPGLSARLGSLAEGPAGGLALIEAAEDSAPRQGLAARLRGPAAVLDLLHGIHAADTLEQALALPLAPGESVVLPDGRWLGPGWWLTPPGGAERGVLAREPLIRQLRAAIEVSAARLSSREGELAQLRTRQQALDGERRELSPRLDGLRARQASRLAFRQAQAVRLEQTQTRLQQLASELAALAQQREQQQAELKAAREGLLGLEDTARRLREERGERQQAQAQARDAVNRARQAQAQAQARRNQIQIQQASTRSQLQALVSALHELAQSRQALDDRREQEQRAAAALESPLREREVELEQARGMLAAVREGLRSHREAVEAAEAARSQAQLGLRLAEQAREQAQEALQAARLEQESRRARAEALRQQFEESCREAELDPQVLSAALPPEAGLESWEEQLAALLRRIDRLGAINLAAIQELEEAETRARYLDEQNADLAGALETLEEAIRKIDGETRERFKDTFDRVDAIFRERFPRLFGGGEAYLELTGDNLLETGVRVMARPPGKRNASIQMLSGGEKAMTAVALLLGLFQLNPAPFCLMDEVDAPLDDANVGRFCEVVREMSASVQFIIITHNKITMELATHLHGVTMQEPGVSRLVSVDVEQAVELAGPAPEREESTIG